MMDNDELLRFLGAIDDELTKDAGENETLELHLLGRSALVLGYGLALMTKDVDIVYAHGSRLQGRAIASFGKGTPGAHQYGFYLEAVPPGLPPLPGGYQGRCTAVPGPWKVLRPKWPEAHDLAASKLKRFHPGDRRDIQVLCDNGLLTADGLRAALDSAFAFAADEDEDPGRRAAYAHLEWVIDYLEGHRRQL